MPQLPALIESYVKAKATAPQATPARVAQARSASRALRLTEALDAYERRCMLLSESGVDMGAAEFSAEFGRSVGYYTGFVFESAGVKPWGR